MREVVAYRLAAWDTPFWVNANRSSGRYNRAGTGPTQYLCLHPLGPWAEYLRRESLRDAVDVAQVRQRVWAVRVLLPDDVHTLTFATARSDGVDARALIADDHRACQDLGERLRSAGAGALLRVPSAALPGTQNLVVFGARLLVDYAIDIWDATLDMPACVAAERAQPPAPLLPLVRHRGMLHAEYEAWRHRRAFVFREPAFAKP